MNPTILTTRSPMPETCYGIKISSLLDRSKHTPVGKQAKRWHDLEVELTRLNNRRAQVAGDKVITSVIDDRISDNKAVADQIVREIANTPARNTIDIVCKHAITTRMQCNERSSSSSLSSSTLSDLLRVVNAVQKDEG